MSKRRPPRMADPTPDHRPTRTCEACHDRPAARGWGICRGCHRRTAMHLSDLAEDLTAELEVTLTGQGRTGPARHGSRTTTTPLPFDVRASAVMVDIHARMASWCLLVRDEASARLPEDTIHDMAGHLLGWLDWLAKHEAVGEFVTEVASLVRQAYRAIDLPPTRSQVFVGPCPEVDEEPCPGELWANFPRDESQRPGISCTCCGMAWEPEQWSRLGERVDSRMNRDSAGRLLNAIVGIGA